MELVDARLLFTRRGGGEEAYVFRHALVRDAAYESMVRVTRQRLHRAVAQGLRTHFPEIRAERPERLAHHYEEAGDLPAAAEHWYLGGEHAFRRAAYAEALRDFERALAIAGAAAANAVHVGDSVEEDVEGARAVGIEPVFLSRDGRPGPRGVRAIAGLRELEQVVSAPNLDAG